MRRQSSCRRRLAVVPEVEVAWVPFLLYLWSFSQRWRFSSSEQAEWLWDQKQRSLSQAFNSDRGAKRVPDCRPCFVQIFGAICCMFCQYGLTSSVFRIPCCV